MSKRQRAMRELLRAHPDGIDSLSITQALGWDRRNVNDVLSKMPDAYIDRWTRGPHNWLAVWCAVEVPPNCPHPVKENA